MTEPKPINIKVSDQNGDTMELNIAWDSSLEDVAGYFDIILKFLKFSGSSLYDYYYQQYKDNEFIENKKNEDLPDKENIETEIRNSILNKAKIYMQAYPDYRYGQAVYIAAHDLYGELTDKVMSEDNIDCFYKNEKVNEFINKIIKRVLENDK